MTSGDLSIFDSSNVQVIEWNMLDKTKFVPLSVASILSVRSLIYPLTVIKTRIQIQHKNDNYHGTLKTFRKIYVNEGWSGLYRGFFVNTCQVFASLFYLTTYEKSREILLYDFDVKNNALRALLAGGCASVASQLILVPFDVISQHMMVLQRTKNRKNLKFVPAHHNFNSDALNLTEKLAKNPNLRLAPLVCSEIYKRDGIIKGFYRGYLASLLVYAPSSAMFWGAYHFYCESLSNFSLFSSSYLFVQATAAPASGATIALMTNSLDLFRSNLQVHGEGWKNTFLRLYREERWSVFYKGLSTRMVTMPLSSFLIIVGYELIKRLSVHEKYRLKIMW